MDFFFLLFVIFFIFNKNISGLNLKDIKSHQRYLEKKTNEMMIQIQELQEHCIT